MGKGKTMYLCAMLLLLYASPVLSFEGAHSLGRPDPALLRISEERTWSSEGYWDLTEKESIPPEALIRQIEVKWDMMPQDGWRGLEIKLGLNSSEYESLCPEGRTEAFMGEKVRQIWGISFRVIQWDRSGQPLFMMPQHMVIFWEMPGNDEDVGSVSWDFRGKISVQGGIMNHENSI